MVKVYCQDLNPVCWAWVTEYALRRGIKRCNALEEIIEDHIRFTHFIHERKIRGEGIATKAKKTKKK